MSTTGRIPSPLWLATPITLSIAALLAACGGNGNDTDPRAGDCVVPPPSGAQVTTVVVVDCDEPHDGTVIGVIALDDGPYPGEDSALAIADDRCPGESTFYFIPTEQAWNDGDRDVICVLLVIHDLKLGDCINYPQDEELFISVQRVSCEQPFDALVLALLTIPGDGEFPGEPSISEFAFLNCPPDMDFYLAPTRETWDQEADREIACLLVP